MGKEKFDLSLQYLTNAKAIGHGTAPPARKRLEAHSAAWPSRVQPPAVKTEAGTQT